MPTQSSFRRLHAVVKRAVFAIALGGLLAGATPAAAQVTVNILNPAAPPEADPVAIAVNVTSGSEVTSVQAQIGPHTMALTLFQGNWFGHLPVPTLARGQHQLTVTATNTGGQTGQATKTFMLDRLPVITITSPATYSLGLPEVRATATCVDDSGPCEMTVGMQHGPLLAAGRGGIDATIKPFDGVTTLEFVARDVTTRANKDWRTVVVHSGTRLGPGATFTGRILDVQADRALIYEDTVQPSVVKIVNRATNASETIWTAPAPNNSPRKGFLTPAGALIVVDGNVPSPALGLHEWRGGTSTDLGAVEWDSLKVNGQWAIYSKTNKELRLRNSTTGAETVVDILAGERYNDVTADGRVFYWDFPVNEIFLYEQGPPSEATKLTFAAPLRSMHPATDGVNVVFARDEGSPFPRSLILRTGAGTEILLAAATGGSTPQDSYRIANGWVAFVDTTGGIAGLWLRAPDGTMRKITPPAAGTGSITLRGLSGTGEVIFDMGFPPSIFRRFLARTDGSVIPLGEPLGEPFFIDGAWHMAAAAQLFAVDPNIPARSILSEGATGSFFTTDVSIFNPHDSAVPVTIRYLRENAPEIVETRTLPALSRTTIHEDEVPGLEGTGVSTVVDAPATLPVVAERLMSWDAAGYGGHLGSSVDRPRVKWLFAEGAQGFFHTFFLLANSGASKATVKFTFLIEQGTPVTHTVEVDPGTRKTVYSGDIAGLINHSFATAIESDVPIVAERAMYFGESPLWLGGHGSAGVPEPAYRWFHAEGATGSLFDTFILIGNPHPVTVTVHITYTTDTGIVIKRSHDIAASSRLTINAEDEADELANTSFSTMIEPAWYPIVSERTMYWGTTDTGWREAHNSFGATEPASRWGLAEGRRGGPRGYQTYVLLSNMSQFQTFVGLSFVKENGTTVGRGYNLNPSQRYTVDTSTIAELADSNFSTLIESGVPITVESAIYWNANGVIWEGGGNTVATRLP